MNQVTITLPAIDETVIANLDTLTTQASATEVEALKAIRKKYAILARQNGYVRIGWTKVGDGSNWSQTQDYYYERNGKRIKALKAFDNFEQPNTEQWSGDNTGDRLYLLETGEWLRIERNGRWSQRQGSPQCWACGEDIIPGDNDPYLDQMRQAAASEGYVDTKRAPGSVRIVTDAEVEAEYPLDGVVAELANSLKTLARKLPERMVKVQQRASLAAQLLEKVVDQQAPRCEDCKEPFAPARDTQFACDDCMAFARLPR